MWYGVDFDKTLVDKYGTPITEMVERVRKALKKGKDVRIFTARLTGDNPSDSRREINDFCEDHFGKKLKITNKKDYETEEIWDDKAVNPMQMPKMMGIGNLAGAMKEHFYKNKKSKKGHGRLHRPDDVKEMSSARKHRMSHSKGREY